MVDWLNQNRYHLAPLDDAGAPAEPATELDTPLQAANSFQAVRLYNPSLRPWGDGAVAFFRFTWSAGDWYGQPDYRHYVFADRLTPDGEFRGRLQIEVNGGFYDDRMVPRVIDAAAHADTLLVVYSTGLASGGPGEVHAAMIDGSGHAPRRWKAESAGAEESPTVARLGAGYLVIWRQGEGDDAHLVRGFIEPASPASTFDGAPLLQEGRAQSSPRLFPARGQYLCLFNMADPDSVNGTGLDLYAVRLDASGRLLDERSITVARRPLDQSAFTCAWDGAHYLVVWREWSGGSFQLYGTRVSRSGIVLDGDGFLIEADAGYTFFLDADASGRAVLAYDGNHMRILTETPGLWRDLQAAPEEDGVRLTWRLDPGAFDDLLILRTVEDAGTGVGERVLRPTPAEPPSTAWSYLDVDVGPGAGYTYRLFGESGGERVELGSTSVRTQGTPRFHFLSPAPTPARGEVSLRFDLPASGHARLLLIESSGRLLRTLYDGQAPPGRTRVDWDGRDGNGRRAPNGVYFLRLQWNGQQADGRVALLR